MFVAVSSSQKAAKVIDGIRDRYNISILYEQTDLREADYIEISYLRKRYPRLYITLITEALKAEDRKITYKPELITHFHPMLKKIVFNV